MMKRTALRENAVVVCDKTNKGGIFMKRFIVGVMAAGVAVLTMATGAAAIEGSVRMQYMPTPAASPKTATGGVGYGMYGAGSVNASLSATQLLEKRISTDNMQEYRSRQQAEIAEFLKKKKEELAAKTKLLQEQKKQCQNQLTEALKQRQAEKKTLVESCKPSTLFSGLATSSEEAKTRAAQLKQFLVDCKEKMKAFEEQSKQQMLSIKETCFNKERSVLGLSTTVPYNR